MPAAINIVTKEEELLACLAKFLLMHNSAHIIELAMDVTEHDDTPVYFNQICFSSKNLLALR